MSLDLHPDLRCLVMVDGTVFGNIDDADTIRPMEIRQGASMAPFEPCDDSPVSLFEVVEEYRLQTRSLVTQSR